MPNERVENFQLRFSFKNLLTLLRPASARSCVLYSPAFNTPHFNSLLKTFLATYWKFN